MYYKVQEFVENTLKIINFSIVEKNFIQFDELLSLKKIEEVEQMHEERLFMSDCDELRTKIKKIRDKVNL